MSATPGSIYIAGFAQSGAPHAAIMLASSAESGTMAHIVAKNDQWTYQFRSQKIQGSMSLTSLVKIRDASKGALSKDNLKEIFKQVPVPSGDAFGECIVWVKGAIEALSQHGIVALTSSDSLMGEFTEFCSSNKSYASSGRYPNVMTSSYCS